MARKKNSNRFLALGLIVIGGIAYLLYKKGGGGGDTYTCPYCGESFTSQAALDNHIATTHSGGGGAPEGKFQVSLKNVAALHAQYDFNYMQLLLWVVGSPSQGGGATIQSIEYDLTNFAPAEGMKLTFDYNQVIAHQWYDPNRGVLIGGWIWAMDNVSIESGSWVPANRAIYQWNFQTNAITRLS